MPCAKERRSIAKRITQQSKQDQEIIMRIKSQLFFRVKQKVSQALGDILESFEERDIQGEKISNQDHRRFQKLLSVGCMTLIPTLRYFQNVIHFFLKSPTFSFF